MGSYVEFNDTLQITTDQGFPANELELARHLEFPYLAEDFKGRTFSFRDKPGARLFHPPPNRVFLVHNIDGRWLYWGHVLIMRQVMNADDNTTSGEFNITKIYRPEHQRSMSTVEASPGCEYIF